MAPFAAVAYGRLEFTLVHPPHNLLVFLGHAGDVLRYPYAR